MSRGSNAADTARAGVLRALLHVLPAVTAGVCVGFELICLVFVLDARRSMAHARAAESFFRYAHADGWLFGAAFPALLVLGLVAPIVARAGLFRRRHDFVALAILGLGLYAEVRTSLPEDIIVARAPMALAQLEPLLAEIHPWSILLTFAVLALCAWESAEVVRLAAGLSVPPAMGGARQEAQS